MRLPLLLAAFTFTAAAAACSSNPSPTVMPGPHHIQYHVDLLNGTQQGRVEIAYNDDPVNNSLKRVTAMNGTWPWTKDYQVTDPNAVYTDVEVDNTNDSGATLTCSIAVDGSVQVSKKIAPGQKGSCSLGKTPR